MPVSHLSHADQEKAEREVNILATLEHPHIVRYDRAFVRMGQLCIVMEHAAGGDLASHVASLRRDGGRASPSSARPSGSCSSSSPSSTCTRSRCYVALGDQRSQTALVAKVLHRDVSLKNIFLFNDQNIKLGASAWRACSTRPTGWR